MKVFKKIEEWTGQGLKTALIILTHTQGSVPAPRGALLAVNEKKEIEGTVGGGSLEYRLVEEALAGMDQAQAFESSHSLTEKGSLDMVCGGQATAFIRYFLPEKELIIFGGGHIAQALAPLAQQFSFQVTIIEDRADLKDLAAFDQANFIVGEPAAIKELSTNKDNSYLVICTRGHEKDEEALELSLKKDFKYLGMIGSKRKIASIKERLLAKGFGPADFEKIHMPIGLDIDDGSVEEIALGILAEIIMVKNKGQGKSLKGF